MKLYMQFYFLYSTTTTTTYMPFLCLTFYVPFKHEMSYWEHPAGCIEKFQSIYGIYGKLTEQFPSVAILYPSYDGHKAIFLITTNNISFKTGYKVYTHPCIIIQGMSLLKQDDKGYDDY